MEAVEFIVRGDAARAKATVIDALQSRQFRLTWTGDWDGIAERGNKTANVLLGAFAQYFRIDLAIRTAPDGNGVIHLGKSTKGYMGGAIGASRTTKNFDGLVADLQATFAAAGVLVNVFAR